MSSQERTAVIVDHVSVPRDINYEHYIQNAVNTQYEEDDRRVVSVVRMASEACWGIQLADLLTSAVHLARRLDGGDPDINPDSPKAQLAEHVRQTFNLPSLVSPSTPNFRVRDLFKA